MSEEDLEAALEEMDSTIDVSGQDLAEIYRLARQHVVDHRLDPDQLRLGRCYSNGRYGDNWQVRQIIDMKQSKSAPEDLLIYKVVAGAHRRRNGTASFADFARWASYEVFLNENSWQRREQGELAMASPEQSANIAD